VPTGAELDSIKLNGVLPPGPRAGVGAGIEQGPDRGFVALSRRQMQWGRAVFVVRFAVGAGVEQGPHRGLVAPFAVRCGAVMPSTFSFVFVSHPL